jgi:hypothetical protein
VRISRRTNIKRIKSIGRNGNINILTDRLHKSFRPFFVFMLPNRSEECSPSDKGKRGGARLIYYWQTSKHKTYMLLAYTKAKKKNLEPEQIAILKALVKELERHG